MVFKVGDQVQVINDVHASYFTKGKSYVVHGARLQLLVLIDDNCRMYYIASQDVKKITKTRNLPSWW